MYECVKTEYVKSKGEKSEYAKTECVKTKYDDKV